MKNVLVLSLFITACSSTDNAPKAATDTKAALTEKKEMAETKVAEAKCTFAPVANAKMPGAIVEHDVASLKEVIAAGTPATIFDANSSETREKFGAIPGAKLLSHYKNFEASELPEDKTQAVVFYCGSTQCTASDVSACKAKNAGYSNVNVLRPGIKGWIDAGEKTTISSN